MQYAAVTVLTTTTELCVTVQNEFDCRTYAASACVVATQLAALSVHMYNKWLRCIS
jgi:hypothetical protein